jgi:hypothetical protein
VARPRWLLNEDGAGRDADLVSHCTVIFEHFLGILSR